MKFIVINVIVSPPPPLPKKKLHRIIICDNYCMYDWSCFKNQLLIPYIYRFQKTLFHVDLHLIS